MRRPLIRTDPVSMTPGHRLWICNVRKTSSMRTQARFIGRMLPGAVASSDMPGLIAAVAPTLVGDVPVGERWLHEVKFDGYRMQVHLNRGAVTITSRNGLDWTHRFPLIAQACAALPADRLVMDGEIISADASGASDFGQLQSDLSDGRHERIVYYAFDLMFVDGFDIRAAPLIERKRVLSQFLTEAKPDRILYSEYFDDGGALFSQARTLGLEGIVSKRRDSPYRASKSNWLKVKCQRADELTIIGYVPSGKTAISALRLGRRNGAQFDYVGKVGTGFTRSVSEQLRKQLDRMVILKPFLSEKLRRPDTRWVKPELRARITYRGITGDGKLHHPSFKGLLNHD